MERDLEKFRGGPHMPAQSRMRVTLTDRNVLSLNRNTYHQLGKPPAAYLYFSRQRDLIVIEPVHSLNMSEAFPIVPRNTGYRINVSSFCRHFGIRLDRAMRFIDPEIRDGKLELKLANTVCVAIPRQRSRAK